MKTLRKLGLAACCFAAATLLASGVARAAEPSADKAQADPFKAEVFRADDGGELPYRLLLPEPYDPQQKYPLVLFLHGAGERGNDNQAQLKHVAREFATPENRKKYPCFVLAPQCPTGEKWADVDWSASTHPLPDKPSSSMELTLKVIEQLKKQYSIDPTRMYVSGLSMGGYGTWDVIARYPKIFAAAVPMCGGADEKTAPLLVELPIWDFHGDKDWAVPVARSRNMIDALRKAGGEPKYTEYPGVGHNCWQRAIAEPELLPWLFSQRTPKAP